MSKPSHYPSAPITEVLTDLHVASRPGISAEELEHLACGDESRKELNNVGRPSEEQLDDYQPPPADYRNSAPAFIL